jgi:hypothetical protein
MSIPFEQMLDALEWKPLAGELPPGTERYATHEGVLTIGGHSIRVYQLNDGNRVIRDEDLCGFFGVDNILELVPDFRRPTERE